MKSKATLSLLELVLMLLIFALAAAICMKAFVWSDSVSKQSIAQDMATVHLETVAETLKYYHGDLDAAAAILSAQVQYEQLYITYDETWAQASQGCYYLRCKKLPTDNPLLGGAVLELTDAQGETLSQLSVYWQEVTDHG